MSKEKVLKYVIQPFNGDPDLLEFFIEQVSTKLKNIHLSDSQALTFIKSKLSDKALKFYAQSVPCHKATTPIELFDIFRKNFRGESAQNIAIQYNSLKFNTNENIRTFANRLQNLAFKRFPDLPEDSIGQVLTAKLMDTLPANYKLHLLSQKTENFEQIVESLSTFQEILQSSEFSAVMQQPSFSTVNVNNISSAPTECTPSNIHSMHSLSKAAVNNVNAQVADNAQKSLGQTEVNHVTVATRPQCQWCNRIGHSAQKCFQLKNVSHPVKNYQHKRLQYQRRPLNNKYFSSSSLRSDVSRQPDTSSINRQGRKYTHFSRQSKSND